MPVFAKAGAIVPMAKYADGDNCLGNSENMEVLVFPGADNTFTLYEDAGDGYAYQDGSCVRTEMGLVWGEKPVFTIHPALGDLTLIPETRNWRIGLRGFHRNISASAEADGKALEAATHWDQERNTLWLTVEAPVVSEIRITVEGGELICDNADVLERGAKILGRAQCSYQQKQDIWSKVTDPKKDLLGRITGCIMHQTEMAAFGGAMEELLTLTEDKYLGSELPEA